MATFDEFLVKYVGKDCIEGDFANDWLSDRNHIRNIENEVTLRTYLELNLACEQAIVTGVALFKLWQHTQNTRGVNKLSNPST